MCVTDRHDMTLAGKLELNPNTTDQIDQEKVLILHHEITTSSDPKKERF